MNSTGSVRIGGTWDDTAATATHRGVDDEDFSVSDANTLVGHHVCRPVAKTCVERIGLHGEQILHVTEGLNLERLGGPTRSESLQLASFAPRKHDGPLGGGQSLHA